MMAFIGNCLNSNSVAVMNNYSCTKHISDQVCRNTLSYSICLSERYLDSDRY